MNDSTTGKAEIPLQWVGPVKITGPVMDEEVMLPLATFETPLWPSVNRGARVALRSGGLQAVVVDERMSRSIVLEAPDAVTAVRVAQELDGRRNELAEVVASTSRFARLLDVHTQHHARLLYFRIECFTGDAAGHNMVTIAADRVMEWLLANYKELRYVSISGNLCTDKKVSAVNGLLGRGRHVITELTVPRKLTEKYLKTTPERMVDLHIRKNLVGSILAGSLRSANAHYANMLLAFYLATGQDAANIVEGSQGTVHAEVQDGDLYFSASVPHLIVGTVGAGKGLAFVQENLDRLGCLAEREPGANARRLAVIAAAAVCCGELSLLAAQTNPGELMRAHLNLER